MTKIIAICGVDGAGKSTFANLYASRNQSVILARKDNSYNVERVKKYHARSTGEKEDYLSGSFAECIAIATVYDFLDHYSRNIEPYVGKASVILCDRYYYCYGAYLEALSSRFDIESLCSNVKNADAVIHVDADEGLLTNRYEARGNRTEDEFLGLMRIFRQGYGKYYKKQEISPCYVDNSACLDSGFAKFVACVDKHIGYLPE